MRKSATTRPYKPDYASPESLAYRLDCSVRTIHEYVQAGLLPQPVTIGNLRRWSWAMVEERIYAQNFGDTGLLVVNGEAANEYVADLQKYRARLGKKASGEKGGD